ncbi:MAG: hypothetical protein OXR66_00570 [Candidatus Woesearchaeota archaeon]|nr:hypothetical protein [Candidatus Woesearchaeota archaeon]
MYLARQYESAAAQKTDARLVRGALDALKADHTIYINVTQRGLEAFCENPDIRDAFTQLPSVTREGIDVVCADRRHIVLELDPKHTKAARTMTSTFDFTQLDVRPR